MKYLFDSRRVDPVMNCETESSVWRTSVVSCYNYVDFSDVFSVYKLSCRYFQAVFLLDLRFLHRSVLPVFHLLNRNRLRVFPFVWKGYYLPVFPVFGLLLELVSMKCHLC